MALWLHPADASGSVIERAMYESYGGVVNRPLKDGPGYAGNMTDSVTGLSHMQQRDFDSSVGTFLSMDPATTVENPYANFQRYRYGNGNPYKFVDPDDADATYFQMLVFWLFRLILRVRPQQNPM